jgi:transposase
MPAGRLLIRQVREGLRLKHACRAPHRQIATSVGIGRIAVGEYLRRAAAIVITWPVPDGIDDVDLERRLVTALSFEPPSRPVPDWPHVHAEFRPRDVTLMRLWEEYRAKHSDGYGYSRFCDIDGEWRRGISATMRQTHVAGEKLFVDFAGRMVPVVDPSTRSVVAALGASNFTCAEACWSENVPDWIARHVRALAAIGGVPRRLVCDNTKAGVIAPCRYEPDPQPQPCRVRRERRPRHPPEIRWTRAGSGTGRRSRPGYGRRRCAQIRKPAIVAACARAAESPRWRRSRARP